MRADDCSKALKSHPNRSQADCFTNYKLTVVWPKQAPARSDNFVLADYNCNISATAQMWNWFWWANATVNFCRTYGYAWAYGEDCSNYGAGPGQSIQVTWCGSGVSGSRADGGENVYISGDYGSYGAGQRASMNAYTAWVSFFCWNAYC